MPKTSPAPVPRSPKGKGWPARQMRFPPALDRCLAAAAESEGETVSAYVRGAVRDRLRTDGYLEDPRRGGRR